MKQRINLVTMSDVLRFMHAVSDVKERVMLFDNEGNRVSATSLLGSAYTLEWAEIFVECERDIYTKISEFVVDETPNNDTK